MAEIYKISEIEDSLQKYGLTPKQARLYVAALKTGPAPLQKIAGTAKLGRTNAYDAMHALVAKGLVSISPDGKRHLFVAQSPKTLKRLLRNQEDELNELIPQLEVFGGQSEFKPKVLFYPGLEGCKTVVEDLLSTPNKKLFGIFSPKSAVELFGFDYVDHMAQRRAKKDIHLRVIHPFSSAGKEGFGTSEGSRRDARIAPLGVEFNITTYVYGNKVAMISGKGEMFGMIIESADIAEAHRNYFEALWQISTPDRPSLHSNPANH
jgi:sugar-specific transcriptional regulator TrmB